MNFRTNTLAALVLLIALAGGQGCGPKPSTGTGGGGGSVGFGGGGGSIGFGGGSGGGGTGGGGGGSPSDAGVPDTISAAKRIVYPGLVDLKGVVVTAIAFSARSASSSNCAGTSSPGVNASFWVADPNNPQQGLYVTKFRCDADVDYAPAVGDVLDLKGFLGFEASFSDREAYRLILKAQFEFLPSASRPSVCALPGCQPLEIVKKSTIAPLADNMVPSTFGNAQGGAVKAEPTYAGTRVRIAGPLTVTNAVPAAMKRLSGIPNDSRYYGFELSNGVLVSNFRTFAEYEADGGPLADGGTSPCDPRQAVLAGGTVTYSSVAGVWDTYSHAACADGGTSSSCFRNRGIVPGTPDANYTYVLYPTSCADLVQ